MNKMVWLDLETTGLKPNVDQILEVGIVITDFNLNILSTFREVVASDKETERLMSDFVKEMHTKSGLLKEAETGASLKEVEKDALNFLKDAGIPTKLPLAGSNVSFDRSFIEVQMEEFEKYFHYRNIDVSSIKELCAIWYPEIEMPKKKEVHRSIEDLEESIGLLKFFQEQIFLK